MWIRSIFFLQKHKIYIFLKVYMVGLTVDYGFLITMHKNDKMKTFAVKVVWVLRQQTISASQYATIYDSLCAARVSLWVSLHAPSLRADSGRNLWLPWLNAHLHLHWSVSMHCTCTRCACRTDTRVFPCFHEWTLHSLCTQWKRANLVRIVYLKLQRRLQGRRLSIWKLYNYILRQFVL